MSRKDRRGFEALVYDTLRAYQDGKLKHGCTCVGMLDVSLTNVYDTIVGSIRKRTESTSQRTAQAP